MHFWLQAHFRQNAWKGSKLASRKTFVCKNANERGVCNRLLSWENLTFKGFRSQFQRCMFWLELVSSILAYLQQQSIAPTKMSFWHIYENLNEFISREMKRQLATLSLGGGTNSECPAKEPVAIPSTTKENRWKPTVVPNLRKRPQSRELEERNSVTIVLAVWKARPFCERLSRKV